MTYLLHFIDPRTGRPARLFHAGHYTGWARDRQTFARRIEHHRHGHGARLVAAAIAAGLDFVVARTWDEGDRAKERRLKRSGGASRYCPLCRAA